MILKHNNKEAEGLSERRRRRECIEISKTFLLYFHFYGKCPRGISFTPEHYYIIQCVVGGYRI